MRKNENVSRFLETAMLKIVGAILLLVSAVVLLWYGNVNSMQALPALMAKIYFDGEYRIGDGGPELYYQVMYFIPTVVTLCIAASVTLRRKGYGVTSLIAVLMGPAVFALYLIIFYFCG